MFLLSTMQEVNDMQVNDILATAVWGTTVRCPVTVAIAQNCCVTFAKQWMGAINALLSIAYAVQKEGPNGAICVGLAYAKIVHILGIALDAIKTFVTTTASHDTIALPAERVSV